LKFLITFCDGKETANLFSLLLRARYENKKTLISDKNWSSNFASKISKCNIMTLEELALDESSIVGRKCQK
jgi:hypothetical protein